MASSPSAGHDAKSYQRQAQTSKAATRLLSEAVITFLALHQKTLSEPQSEERDNRLQRIADWLGAENDKVRSEILNIDLGAENKEELFAEALKRLESQNTW